jgi:transaldolase
MSNLHAVAAAGQSVWSDQISRPMLDSGELERRITDDAVTGVTSNPSIFAKAIVGSDDYADQLGELIGRNAATNEIVGALMTADLQRACDALHSVWDRTNGMDGHVSVEVDPELAHETDPSVAEAREWVKRIDRPNLLVKIPATRAGIPAIAALIGEGISINVTLIFSLARYREVMEAYLTGLETFRSVGGDVSKVASVASFFVSRVDTEVDARLDAIGTPEAKDLRGKAAIANALAAYDEFLQSVQRTALGVAGGRRSENSATVVGFDVHQGSRLSRHSVCRRPCRSTHGQHDAFGDNRRLSGSWLGPADDLRTGRDGSSPSDAPRSRRGGSRLRRCGPDPGGRRSGEVHRFLA